MKYTLELCDASGPGLDCLIIMQDTNGSVVAYLKRSMCGTVVALLKFLLKAILDSHSIIEMAPSRHNGMQRQGHIGLNVKNALGI